MRIKGSVGKGKIFSYRDYINVSDLVITSKLSRGSDLRYKVIHLGSLSVIQILLYNHTTLSPFFIITPVR